MPQTESSNQCPCSVQLASESEGPVSKLLFRTVSPLTENTALLWAQSVYGISTLCSGTTGPGGARILKTAQGYTAIVMEAA